MPRSRHNRMIAGAAWLMAAGLAVEGGCLIASRRGAREAAAILAQRNQERQVLASQDPAPTTARAAAIEADLVQAAAGLRAVEDRLWRRDAAAPPPPTSPTDAFFDLTAFARMMAERAARAGVGVKEGERFGFSAYAHDGPPLGVVAAVDRQRRIAAALVQALIAARPQRIEGVQRENPEADGAGTVRTGGDGAGPADFFAMDPRLSLRMAGAVDTTAFRLVFIGDTRTLRNLLNRLAAFDSPAVVRSIAAEPAGEVPPRRPATPGSREPLTLVVRADRSRFSVTVEFCHIAGPAPAPGAADRPPAPGPDGEGGGWPEPAAQARGHEWVYDLFTPPAIYFDPRGPSLHAAAEAVAAEPTDPWSGLDLLEVRRGPFHLQLIGFAGQRDDLRGIFADADSGETVVGRSGDRLPGPGVTIRRLTLERPAGLADPVVAAGEPAAIALVTDDVTGGQLELTTCEPCLAGPPVGLFASHRATAWRRVAEAGDSFVLDGVAYCVEQVDLQPPQALVACAPGDGAGPPVRRWVRPIGPPPTPAGPVLSATDAGVALFGDSP